MEIRLKTAHSNADTGIIVDEYGTLWEFSWTRDAHGVFLATTRGLDGESIKALYQNGTLLIITFNDARKYFRAVNPERDREMHHM